MAHKGIDVCDIYVDTRLLIIVGKKGLKGPRMIIAKYRLEPRAKKHSAALYMDRRKASKHLIASTPFDKCRSNVR